MSRRKRPADGEPNDHDDSNMSPSPPDSSSQIGSEGRKRRRITANSDTTPEHVDGDDIQAHGRNSSESEDDEDSEDSDAAEAMATQALHEKRARNQSRGNVAKEAGVLDSVILQDFMCHRFFEFKLGPLINFICGKNGSGKSAILTAIILCLGGKASTTNRGASLKKFIKEGAEKAIITCKLKNKGEGAYMPDHFGDLIIVERHFNRSGTSGYKITGSANKKASTKRSDLEAIVDHFGLQIENPLNVLSQDMARAFISSSNASEKYKFFIKGVQLERLDQDYSLLGERIAEMEPKLKLKMEDLTSLGAVAKDKKRQRQLAVRRDGLGDQIRDLIRQAVWAKVDEQEKVIAGYEEQIRGSERSIAESEAHVNALDAKYLEADRILQQKMAAKSEAIAALDAAKEEQRQTKNAFDEAKVELDTANTEQRNVGETLKGATTAIEKQMKLIREEELRLLEANGGGAARRLQELEIARRAAQEAKEVYTHHKQGKAEVDAALQQARKREAERSAEKDSRASNCREQRDRLRELQERGQQQRAGAFRRNSERLEAAIQRETRWQYKPIGPIGKHVRLLKPEWSSIIESMFGRNLSDFIVFSKHDSDLLNKLKKQTDCDAGDSIINRTPIVPREPDEQFDTILRVLDIDNEHVKKYLIIQNAIEQQVLIPDITDATAAMYDNGRLHNVKGCFAFDPHDRQKGILLKYTPSGEPSQDPVRAWPGLPRMKSDHEATIVAKRALLDEAEKELAAATTAWQAARMERGKVEASVDRHKNREKELLLASQGADDAVANLEEAIKEDNVENGRLDALKQGLDEAEEQKKLCEEQFKDAVNAKDAKNRILREHRERMNEINTQVAEIQQRVDEAQNDHRQADRKKTEALHDKNNAAARVRDAEVILQRDIERKENAQEALRNFEAEARTKSERVNVPEGETVESIVARIDRLREERRRFQQQFNLSLEDITREAANAEKAYAQSKKDYQELEEVKDQLEQSLKERKIRWHKFRQHITARAKTAFGQLLGERGFRGEIRTNHKTRELDLRVEPDITRRNGEGRNAKTLSGGEKSFSQICMLLAMWEAMGSPIRCLDEFDVFMDAVNRNISVRLITEAARQSSGMQYILISPGSKADIVRASDVAVIDLGQPQRGGEDGQRTLDESGFRTNQY